MMSDALRDLMKIQRDYFKPEEVAKVLGCHPQTIRIAVKKHPEKLGFRVIVIGTRIRIVRASFLRYMGVDEPDTETTFMLTKSAEPK